MAMARLLGDTPTGTAPTFGGITLSNNNTVTFNWGAIIGRTYRVQFKDDLNLPNWTDLSPDISATNNLLSLIQPLTGKQRFYRLSLLP